MFRVTQKVTASNNCSFFLAIVPSSFLYVFFFFKLIPPQLTPKKIARDCYSLSKI